MKCRICASECPPGAKLCRDCAAARKRAFAATVTQPLLAAAGAPSVSQARFAPRPAKPRPPRKSSAPLGARSEAVMVASAADVVAAPKRHGTRWLLLGVALAAVSVYLVVRLLVADHARPSADAQPGASSGDGAGAEAAAPDGAARTPPSPPPAASPAQPAKVVSPVEDKTDAGALLKSLKAGHRKPPSKPALTAAPVAPPAAVAAPAPAPRSVQLPPVVAPKDPWQSMNEGLSRCASEDWMHRGECEQQLRLQYCPNHWGSVWQCPIGPTTDHGQ